MKPDSETAIAAATYFLLAARDDLGWWQDFRTTWGVSSEWVTAYVACALLQTEDSAAQQAAQSACLLLCSQQRINGGWGWNARIPADVDSTVWGLLLAQRLQATQTPFARRAIEFLRSRMPSDGRVSTYASSDLREFPGIPQDQSVQGWADTPHLCVAAAVANIPELADDVWPWLVSCQQQGCWPGYWWFDPAYTTRLVVHSGWMKATDEHQNMCRQAADWATSRIHPEGYAICPRSGLPSPFSTALCANILTVGDNPDHAARLATAGHWLCRQQQADGGWDDSALMRFPKSCVTHMKTTPDVDCLPDHNRIFTAATVLDALVAVQHNLTGQSPRHTVP